MKKYGLVFTKVAKIFEYRKIIIDIGMGLSYITR